MISYKTQVKVSIPGMGRTKPARNVRVFDTTLRDGEQTPGVHFSIDQKVAIAKRLEAYGVFTIEAGFPASSPGDFEAVQRIAQEVRTCEVAALARCVPADIDAAIEALRDAARPVLHMVLGISDVHLNKKLGISRADAIRTVQQSIEHAKSHVAEVEFSLEDATRTERPFLLQVVCAAVDSGATRINIADTVGCVLPSEFGPLIRDVVHVVEDRAIVSVHCHNDLGMATANTIAAVLHGAQQVEVTVNGIGERAGNAALEEVAVALHLKGIAETGIRLGETSGISAFVAEASGVSIQENRAIVGANAFAHSSGIHQDGIIKDAATYEFVPPQLVGKPGHSFILTARSGRSAIEREAKASGYDLTPEQVDQTYQYFVAKADRTPGAVTRECISGIIKQIIGRVSVTA